ncbi:tRNA (adenosine(37)-N6)-threonylcarbamoyltransferase complex ATPase subunit type 1 TsaE [Neisseria sp. 83E34]|uniref:tRNA (adenosine(37)-N6)-threonylcarbamoyltransferase complex ATPase subunit type 1 TsaE n=1 Tax=Neisseria sp. 83E34 TaxID=1692264 RepID=UPI0006CEA987|nr:tRNA (adenosine(37)-N6)-threonylcarbamoyltransferase complex ATPase subunit type 1 TsaE [Neisseria sp. 83E34]KPN71522.1 phosphotransferase [Neisseria sp. 83E34]
MAFSQPHTVFLPDEAATAALGAAFAPALTAPLVVYLQGSLGAGKTTFTRGLLRGTGYTGTVKSPTYALVESYPLDKFTLHHFDLYRFASPEEWEDAGLDELFGTDSVCLIEWPQQGGALVPAADITVNIEHQETGRLCTLTAHTAAGRQSLETWKKN